MMSPRPFRSFLVSATSAFIVALLAFHPRPASAEDSLPKDMDARRALASKVLELAYSPDNLRDSFSGFLNPALDAMKREGMPDAARAEMKQAFLQWFDDEVKWQDIKPQMTEIYAKDFSTEELQALLAFLDKPIGQKVMAKLPLVMQDGALVGQKYFQDKESSLNDRLAPIITKYQGKGGGEPPAATPKATPPQIPSFR